MLTLFQHAIQHGHKVAIRERDKTFTYAELLQESRLLASALLNENSDMAEARVAFLVNPGFDYVKTQWAIWLAGGVAVPIFLQAPLPSIQYTLDDTAAGIMIVSTEYTSMVAPLCRQLGVQMIDVEDKQTRIVTLPVV